MKKITLFLVAIFAMINVASAQRAWAYDLELTSSADSYTFAFKAVTAGDATLVFYKEGVEAGTLNLGSVSAGANTFPKTSEELLAAIQQSGEFTWGVKMTGDPIDLAGTYLTELTAAGQGLDFYLPQGLVVDNNPESETFGTFFIAEAKGGELSVGGTTTHGIFYYDQTLTELNSPNTGVIPSNVTLPLNDRNEMHRIAINPVNNHVAFAYNVSGSPAVWSVPANDLDGEAINLIAGTAITMPNSICFDENGALYVMDNANATTGGTLYKVVDGVATKLVQNKTWQQVDNSLAYDGRGGIWIAQTSTGTTWPSYAILSHVNSSGEIDWSALDHSSEGLFSAGNSYGYSQRGQCAYNTKEDLLVLGGNCRSHIFQVTYNAAGVPSLTLKYRTPYIKASTNIDGAAFDYAGDLYLMSASRERLYKYVVPTNSNTCTVPAKKSQVIKLESITLNAHPVKDYSASIVGTMKRAIQNGENTIVLTHEDDGTPHIYNIAHTTKTVTEISQEGVNAAADGFLSISDIAVTEDGKLVACNYVHCTFTASNTSYFYIWDDIASTPRVWFTSQKSGNYNDAYMGYTMALKGTSLDAEVTISAFNKSNSNTRYSHLYVVDGTYTDASYKYSRDNAALHPNTLGKNTYELNASPLAAGKWIVDGELASPIEFVEKNAVAIDTYTALNTNVLGKKFNGASYLSHNDHHLMVAPYAADDKLAGVKVLGITDGFDAANLVITNTDLANTIDATSAAATAYVDGDGDLTIYLIADGKVYTFSEKVYTAQTFTVTANAGEGGTVEGGGPYEENTTATLTATPAEHYEFTGWTGDVTSSDNPLTITVNSDMTVTANFQEHTKYTITAHAADNTMGYVTGGKAYYAGETVTLKAVANSTYYFVNWSDGVTDAIRTFTATADVTLTANFAKATSRAWAYDLKMVEDGDNYKFSFTATTAANATLLFLDKEGNELYAAHDIGAVAAGANTVSIEKAYFTQVKDVYWSVKMDGEAITAVAEITDQSRGIYDFYSTLGMTVDNNPNSEYFGKVYVQATLNGASDGATTRADNQTAGLFIYNQLLDELNPTSNVGIQPSLPAGYGIGSTNQFNRLAIDPTTNNITYCYAISGQPAVFSMDRANLTGTPANLLAGQSGITRSVAHCFDTDGALYVMDLPGSGTIYKIKDGVKTQLTETTNKFVNVNITMTSDGRGGLWVSQNRGQMDGSPYYYQLAHVTSAGAIDWAVNQQTPHGFEGSSSRGALAYDIERQILAQGRNGKVELYTVAYDATTGVPTLTPLHTIASDDLGNNIDGLAFDFAGDLYVVNSSKEKFQKFTLPTADNICTVPAPKSQFIEKEQKYTVTVEASPAEGGEVSGGGEAVEGAQVTISANANTGYRFVNWTKGSDEVSTDASFSYTVPAENVTLIANFEEILYTLIAPTNDENKGTVTGAGTYSYGTVVTLTATPKEGYKLLYWSDRSTENPRNITMTKNEALSAYFVKEYVVEPTFTVEKVWENTNVPGSAAGYQAVGWDGKIYMQNKTEGKIKVYNNGTDAAVDYADSNTSGQQIAVDEAGNLIVFNAYFATATPSAIQIYKNGSTTGTAISFTLPHPERCDFISASGDIYSAEGGYVYFYCQNKNAVNRVKITNGELASVDAIGNTANLATSVSHVMVDIFGNLAAHCRSTAVYAINSYTGETTAFNTSLSGIKLSTLGGCSFELGGKEFWAYNVGTTHYNSEWNLYNMTDKVFMSNETLYAKDKDSKKNTGPANWLNVQVVDENTAYIYQFCPEVAVAVWKVTMHEVVLRDTENNEDLLIDLNGSTTNVSVYRSLTGGMYNTLCLPFDVPTLAGTPLENATVWQYNGATVKGDGTSKEIFLDFAEVTSIAAGEPYLVEPAEDIAAPMEFKNVTISVATGSEAQHSAVTMHGILHPKELQANNKSILFLVENNNLAWANETANMNGMRAYFKVNEPSLLSARTRAYIRREPTVATDMENITTSETEIKKVIYNGTLYIIRGDEVYTIQGTKVK